MRRAMGSLCPKRAYGRADIIPHAFRFGPRTGVEVRSTVFLLLPRQQDAATGVDDAAIAICEVQRNVGGRATLGAIAGDEEEDTAQLLSQSLCLLHVGAADNTSDTAVAAGS